MQPDFVGTNQTKEVCSHVFGKVLKFRSRHLFSCESYDNENGGVVAPVKADPIVDSLNEWIAFVPSP